MKMDFYISTKEQAVVRGMIHNCRTGRFIMGVGIIDTVEIGNLLLKKE